MVAVAAVAIAITSLRICILMGFPGTPTFLNVLGSVWVLRAVWTAPGHRPSPAGDCLRDPDREIQPSSKSLADIQEIRFGPDAAP
jgi:hypothetical protein